jgi:hypothetical protein
MQQRQMINFTVSVAERLDAQSVASNLSNNATRLCQEGNEKDALQLYFTSFALLEEASSVSVTSSSGIHEYNGCGCVLAKDEEIYSSFTEVRNFTEPLLIPIDDNVQGPSEEQSGMRAICGDNVVELIVIYNMGILFMKTKQLVCASQCLDLAYFLLRTNCDPRTLHPTFRVAITYNFALASINCSGVVDANVWQMLTEATDICSQYLADHPLFIVLFSQMGGLLMNCGNVEDAQKLFNLAVAGFNRRMMENEHDKGTLFQISSAAAA